jgi:hypothetical protein
MQSEVSWQVKDYYGRMVLLRLVNLAPGPPAVTAWSMIQGSLTNLHLDCPRCRGWSGTESSALDAEVGCPNCGRRLKVNPFADADWRPIACAWGNEV